MLVIGSTTLIKAGVPWAPAKDLDIICNRDEYSLFTKVNEDKIVYTDQIKETDFIVFMVGSSPIEFEIAENNNSAEQLLSIVSDKRLAFSIDGDDMLYAVPSVIYALKMSHRYKKSSRNFRKTMDNIHALRKYLGTSEIHPDLKDWYKVRMAETYDYAHPKLNQSKQNFFSADGINYIYDHDSIHESVKIYSRPAFELIKNDKADVFCSKLRFFNEVTEEIRLATVLEEAYTLALERSQIPQAFQMDPEKSFLIALEKICTSIASGWWREYAWENYYHIKDLYNSDYIEKFQIALEQGLIKPYEQNNE